MKNSSFWSPQPRYRLYTSPTRYLTAVKNLFNSNDDKVHTLEKKLKDFFQTPYAIATPTARFGIYLVIKHLIKPGQEVILSPITISDVVNMVICAGGIPVFTDVEKETCNINSELIEDKINSNTGAVLITHLHGLACDLNTINELCRRKNIPLIEDSAQAFTTEVQGKRCGTTGIAGIYSFGSHKNITGFFGGAIILKDKELCNSIRKEISQYPVFPLSNYFKKVITGFLTDIATFHGLFQIFTFKIFKFAFLKDITKINDLVIVDKVPVLKKSLPQGYKLRMRPTQAAVILKQLSLVERDTEERIKRAKIYYNGLKSIPQLTLPPMKEDLSHIYTYYPIQFSHRRELNKFALRNNRDWVLSHYQNHASVKAFSEYYSDCPMASSVANTLIYLPTYPRYPISEVYKNIDTLKKYFRV